MVAPGADAISSVPFSRTARRRMLSRPWPSLAAEVSKPAPSSAIASVIREPSTRMSIVTVEHLAWRAALFTASLKMSNRSRRTSMARRSVSGTCVASKRSAMARDVSTSSACCRIRRIKSTTLSRFGLIAQTMSLIELTDSRAMRAIDDKGPDIVGASGDLAEQCDTRQVGADVVVQVGGDAGPHVRPSSRRRATRWR